MEDRLVTPQIAILVMLSFIMGTSEFIIIGILPDMSADMGYPYTAVGNLISIFAIGYAVLTPILTACLSRYSRYRVLVSMCVLFLLTNLWTLFAGDYIQLAASRLLTAAFSGALLGVGLTFVMDLVTPRFRPGAVALIYSGFSISSVVGVPLGTAMSHTLGWRSVFILILIMGAVGTVVAARMLPNLPSSGNGRSGKSGIGPMMRDKRILLGVMVTIFGAMGYYSVYTYMTPILETEIGFTEANVSIGLMILGIAMLISNIVSGKVAGKGGMRILRYTYIAEAVFLFMLPTAVASPVLGMIVLVCFALLIYIMNSPTQIHLMELASRDHPEALTFVSSLNPSSFNIGIAIGSFVGGVFYDAFGLNTLGYLGGMLLLVASAMTFATCYVCRGVGKGTSVT